MNEGIGKILLIRFSSLGDIILTYPLLNKLRRRYPSALIDFAVKEEYADAILMTGLCNNVLVLKDDLTNLRHEVRKNKYDVILDLHKNLKSFYVKAFNSKTIKTVSKNSFRKFLLVNGGIDLFDTITPVYEKYIRTGMKALEIEDLTYETSLLEKERVEIPFDSYIVIAPCSKHFTKTYPADKFIEFIKSLRETNVVLVGSDSEKDIETCSQIADATEAHNLCGKLELRQLAYVLANAGQVITNDSAVLHLSEALGRKVTAIFGSTVAQFGFFPQLKTSRVYEQSGLSCRPCSHFGLNECPVLTFDCMRRTVIEKQSLGLK